MYPADLRYTPEHEWVRAGDTEPSTDAGTGTGSGSTGVRVGITSYAQEALGDIVYVTLPEPGTEVTAGQPLGEVESTKSVSDVYAPVTGTIVARNEALDGTPELINRDPYGEGWMLEIAPADPADIEQLLDAEGYQRELGSA